MNLTLSFLIQVGRFLPVGHSAIMVPGGPEGTYQNKTQQHHREGFKPEGLLLPNHWVLRIVLWGAIFWDDTLMHSSDL